MTPKIPLNILPLWRGTDADLADGLGVSRQAISLARKTHGIPAMTDGRKTSKRALTKTLTRAIVKEAKRRGVQVLDVMRDLNVWAGDVATMGGGE